jgi:hypothetical protein
VPPKLPDRPKLVAGHKTKSKKITWDGGYDW